MFSHPVDDTETQSSISASNWLLYTYAGTSGWTSWPAHFSSGQSSFTHFPHSAHNSCSWVGSGSGVGVGSTSFVTNDHNQQSPAPPFICVTVINTVTSFPSYTTFANASTSANAIDTVLTPALICAS